MGLSVLQKWMAEGRGLGVSRTGVWTQHENKAKTQLQLHFGDMVLMVFLFFFSVLQSLCVNANQHSFGKKLFES